MDIIRWNDLIERKKRYEKRTKLPHVQWKRGSSRNISEYIEIDGNGKILTKRNRQVPMQNGWMKKMSLYHVNVTIADSKQVSFCAKKLPNKILLKFYFFEISSFDNYFIKKLKTTKNKEAKQQITTA